MLPPAPVTMTVLPSMSPAMDTLVSVGTITAWAYSVFATVEGSAVFFDTAAMITTLILLGLLVVALPNELLGDIDLDDPQHAPAKPDQPGQFRDIVFVTAS